MTNSCTFIFFKKGVTILFLVISSFPILYAQQNFLNKKQNHGQLIQFAKQKSAEWTIEKRKADSLAGVLNIPISYIEKDSDRIVILQRLGPKNKPVYYATDNISVAATISADAVWSSNNAYPSLTGEGIEINLWDGGAIRTTHQELQNGPGSRIVMRDLGLPLSNHSTHISGTMIATGVNGDARGMAGKAIIKAWDLSDDIAEMSGAAADGIVLSNHSYGPFCGWSYNSSNESWYWYGDPEISATEDYEFGFYNQVSADLDFIAEQAPNYLIVKSAGNDRNDVPTTSFVHYVWDETWKLVNIEREPDGGADGFDCLTPMAVAKNILTVGAVDDAKAMTLFSAFGPTDDGRVKPDVVSNGSDVFSSTAATDNSYTSYSGTSMANASATGSVALLDQLQNTILPGVTLLSSTIKGILIHTATDTGNSGPDYSFGWGILNIKEAADLIYDNANNQGKYIYEKELTDGEVITIPVKTTGTSTFLKATLCWTDPAGQPSTPSLNQRTKKLVNDLDVKIENSSTLQTYLPWLLNVQSPAAPATRGINDVDNVEQVYIVNPGNNNFNIKISHSGAISGGSQIFSLIISGVETNSQIFPPQSLSYSINETSILLNWNPSTSGTPQSYRIYRNGTSLAETLNTTYTDQSIILDHVYEYYVTAVYNLNEEIYESLGTNIISVYPQTLRSLPFIVDFETEPTEVLIKNDEVGWQWGDSESLNCYYLNFSDNTTKFIGIDSYSVGESVHVSDIAATVPLRLANYSDIVLTFDYLLKTGIYDAIDELHVVYKLQEETEWQELYNLESSFNWKNKSIELPAEMCKNGTQIGFYYDDFYQWGMGAGLDNIQLSGTLNIQEDISLQSIDAPISELCIQDNPLNLGITIKNTGNTTVLSGAIVTITTLCNGIQKERNYTLTQDLTAGSSKSITFPLLIDPLPAGTHLLTVDISWNKDQNLSNNSKSKDILINALPEISFTDPPQILCEDGVPVQILAVPAGGTFEGAYLIGNSFDPAAAGLGEHKITYTFTDANTCTSSSSITIEVVALPEVSFSGLSESYCIDNLSVNLTGIPSGGTFSGPGISNTTFSPGVAGAGIHIIQYAFEDENGCMNFKELQTTVYDLTTISFTNLADIYCQNENTIQLSALPAGGTFYVNDQITDYLHPDEYPPGNVEISYIFQNERGCTSSLTKNITILAPPDVTITDPGIPLCFMDDNIMLNGVPAGGIFTGNLIEENTFNPEVAGIGQHEIIYTFTDANNCTNADSLTLTVVPLPEVSFSALSTQYCINDEISILNGIPSGGVFSGPGIIDNSFVPERAGPGTHQIQYTYTDQNGCANSDLQQTTVYDLTPLIFINLQESYCQNGSPVELSAIPAGGTFTINGEIVNYLDPGVYPLGSIDVQYSYQNGYGCESTLIRQVIIETLPDVSITDPGDSFCLIDMDIKLEGQPAGGTFTGSITEEGLFNPIHSGVGNHEIIYSYNDGNDCQNADTIIIEVLPLPEVSFTGLSEAYCANETPSHLTGIPFDGIFSGDGIEGNSFNPELAGIGEAGITYRYTDENGCTNDNIQSTTVIGLTEVSLLNLSDFYCENDAPVELSAAPEGGVFFVNSLKNNVLDPLEIGAGDVEVSYEYTDENGCMSMDQKIIKILSLPEVGIDGLSEMYCQINQDYVLTGSPQGGNFILEGETITHFNPMELGIGDYELFYEYTDYEGCVGSTSQSFFITSNPAVSIEGLASHYCPNGESVMIEGVPSGGIFEGPGINDNVFSPNSLLPGGYQITYTYNQNGCFATASATISITDPVEVIINGLNPEYCASDSLREVTGIPQGGLFSTKPIFDEAAAGSAIYNLYYTYTDANNCVFADSGRFEVYTKPDFTTPNQLEVSETDTLTLELQDPDLVYYWPNDSTSKTLSIIGNQFEMGKNILPITILDENGCLNIFEVVFYVKGITSTNDEEMIEKIILYPNPAGNYLNIQLPADAKNNTWAITIFDLNGKWTSHWENMKFFDRKLVLDVSNLLPGFYFISISGVNQHFTEKFNVIR